ncbi:MAG: DUF2071 domain-containing protein [Bacilli bacterium]|jgi:hypothetical protein|uniref:YqjF family protein n=1 Tax=Ureibacillus suwonensis TaxID=313007 RepID=A0ABW0RFG7_9BACL|nr:hypothetical protein [Bacilli bacterium]
MGESYASNKYVLPAKIPWLMKQTWSDILFLHYPVKKEVLELHLPPNLELDTYEGTGWVTIVPYMMKASGFRGLPSIPMGAGIPGINVRTYVKAGEKPGIYFFKLAIRNRLAAIAAKSFFQLPYLYMDISLRRTGETVCFESRAHPIPLVCEYRVQSPASPVEKGSLGEWLLERYCFYTTGPKGKLLRGDIFHESWIIQNIDLIGMENNIFSTFRLNPQSFRPVIHYSKQLNVHFWPLVSME